MSAPPNKTRTKRSKASNPRPLATSSISQPVVEDAWSSTILSSFSPDAQLFAFVSLAVDKHRLRIFDTRSGHAIVEHVIDRARVTSLAWISYETDTVKTATEPIPLQKRKKLDASSVDTKKSNGWTTATPAISLGLSVGEIQLLSPVQGRILSTLSHAKSKSPVLAIADGEPSDAQRTIWTSSADCALRLWDLHTTEILLSVQSTDEAAFSALSVRPALNDSQLHILAASHTIHLFSSADDSADSEVSVSEDLKEDCKFGGHASPVKSLLWDRASLPSMRFYSRAECDRFIYVWGIPESGSSQGRLVACYSLDTDVRQIDLSSSTGRQVLLALSSSDKITLCPVPEELGSSTGAKGSAKQHIPSLLPRTTINLSKKAALDVHVAAAVFLPNNAGKIRVALASGGVKISFLTLEFLNNAGEFIAEISLKPSLKPSPSALAGAGDGIAPLNVNKRYNEPSSLSVATGAEISHDPALAAIVDHEVEGVLDADLAELSLGQRLAARSDAVRSGGLEQRSSESDAKGIPASGLPKSEREKKDGVLVPAHSLTRALIQALHAGDTSLLEACLSHSDEMLIRNTVMRLPSQLAVPLITACVERLGRGARGHNIKGRGGSASAQRGMSLIKWVRAVLTIHSGHLIAMPDLVARLSHLYSTLTTRLTLQDRLLSLSGRLDLVLAQVELRSSNAPAPLPSQKHKSKRRGKVKAAPLRYIEGESSEEEVEEGMQIDGEENDNEGSLEDVELGMNTDDESGEGSSFADEDDEDDNEDNFVKSFIDDEAEDYDQDESLEDSE